MKTLQRLLLALWILLIPFQNSGLQGTPLGYLGASPAFLPLIGLICVSALVSCMHCDRARISRSVLLVICYALVVNLGYLLSVKLGSHGTSVVVKAATLSVLTFLLLYPVFFVDYGSRVAATCIHVAFAVTVLGIILGDVMGLDKLFRQVGISYYPNVNMRPRGFTLESSWLSALVVTLGLLSAHFARTSRGRTGALVIMGLAVLFSASKGGTLCLSAVALVAIAQRVRRYPALAICIVPILGVMAYATYSTLSLRFAHDIAEFTSTATRLGLAVTSVLTVVSNPFGVGFVGFLPAVDQYAPVAAAVLDRMVPMNLHLTELLSYVGSGSDYAIGTKTFLFDFLMYYGWPFLLGFVVFHYRLLRRLAKAGNLLLWIAVAYSMIAVCTYINPIGLYNFSLVYGVAFHELRRKENPASVA